MGRTRHSRLELSLVVLAVAMLRCASLPRPEPVDVARARTHFPEATLASLEAGRQVFVESCSGCHALPRPETKSAEQWPRVLDEMAGEAKLTAAQRDLIAQFLVTMSERAAPRDLNGSKP